MYAELDEEGNSDTSFPWRIDSSGVRPCVHVKEIPCLSILEAEARRIEMVADRNYPFGTKLKHEIKGRLPPEFSISLRQIGARQQGV